VYYYYLEEEMDLIWTLVKYSKTGQMALIIVWLIELMEKRLKEQDFNKIESYITLCITPGC
jgi:hypothetical protein